MSQLDSVLRRSIAHIHPSDWEGRDRVFASAREAMIRLLRVYDPPLTSDEIDSKIAEFDEIVRMIEVEYRWARPSGEALALAPPDTASASPAPDDGPRTPAALPPPDADEAFDLGGETEQVDEFDDEDYDDYEDYDVDDEDYDEEPRSRFLAMVDSIGWRTVAVVSLLVLLVGGGVATLAILANTAPRARAPAEVATGPSSEPPAASSQPAPSAAPAPAQVAPAPAGHDDGPPEPAAQGDLALETIVLFDGRDPSVFESSSENPVVFQGDQDGGFARISSSTASTGARVEVGRGVYERIAGHRVRIVIVARASRTAPAPNLRFAYQNGRVQSPWTDVSVGQAYTPLSAVWTAPKDRGGPENDSLIIEPGIPGDGTSVDVRSVRIEILN